jgi:hypothetical protein
MIPDIGEIYRRADVVDLLKILVVFIIGFVWFPQKAKPDTPFV